METNPALVADAQLLDYLLESDPPVLYKVGERVPAFLPPSPVPVQDEKGETWNEQPKLYPFRTQLCGCCQVRPGSFTRVRKGPAIIRGVSTGGLHHVRSVGMAFKLCSVCSEFITYKPRRPDAVVKIDRSTGRQWVEADNLEAATEVLDLDRQMSSEEGR